MGSRFFRSLFSGSSNHSSSLKSGSGSYDSAAVLEPPVKGSYPVAGNGPNVEETLQRARAKREAKQSESRANTIVNNIVSRAPSIKRNRGGGPQAHAHTQRPSTAPHSGEPGGGRSIATKIDDGRTKSGFSTKSPPSFFSRRRNSLFSSNSPPAVEPLPPLPTKPAVREVQTYTPTKGPTPSSTPAPPPPPPSKTPEIAGFVPPFAQKQHHRNFSRNSQSSHVDILDAYSTMRGKEVASVRAKASGVRNYGEDVADRNIAIFGDQKLDLNSSEFGYLKSVYGGKREHGGDEVAQQKTSRIPRNGDDTKMRAKSEVRSSTPLSSGVVSPEFSYDPTRMDRASNYTFDRSDSRSQALLPSSHPSSPPSKNPRRKDSDPIDLSTLPRGRQIRDSSTPINPPQRLSSLGQLTPRVVSPVQESPRSASFQTSPPKPTHYSRPSSKTGNHRSSSQRRSISRSSSVTYSAFPNTSPPQEQTSTFYSRPMSTAAKRSYTIDGAKEAPSLEGVVDLNNTVDTEVITKTLPAVTHEHVIPTRHEHRQEKITREIHTHDVFHRILPVIETEILPAKHYIYAPDGKSLIEVPADQVPGRTRSTSASGHWQFVPTAPKQEPAHQRRRSSNPYIAPQQSVPEPEIDESAEPPVIGLARGEPPFQRSRANSRASIHTPKASRTKNLLDPILGSKRESITENGSFKKEYIWSHQSQFTNSTRSLSSRTGQGPTYIGAGIGDISPESVAAASGRDFYFSDDTDASLSPDFRKGREGEDLLFRDSGYGNGGLPGIKAGGATDTKGLTGDMDKMRSGHVAKRSEGSGKEVLVEREDESDEEIIVEGRFRLANQAMRKVRKGRSGGDLRRRSGAQDVEGW